MNFAGDILISVQRFSLDALAAQQLELAAAHGGRVASDTVVGGHERVLRQTVVGMIKGAEHANTTTLEKPRCMCCGDGSA